MEWGVIVKPANPLNQGAGFFSVWNLLLRNEGETKEPCALGGAGILGAPSRRDDCCYPMFGQGMQA